MRAIRYNRTSSRTSPSKHFGSWSQSAMRAIRYNPGNVGIRVDNVGSQSAMRAIRYNLGSGGSSEGEKKVVAIRYACNKI